MGACASKKKPVTALVPESRMGAAVESSVATSTSGTTVEEHIESSKSHWSELAEPGECLSVEEAAAMKLDNEKVFKAWQSHPEWGCFFIRFDAFRELKVGEKFAEGARAELFHVHVRWPNPEVDEEDLEKRRKWVAKVFKEGTLLRDLQRQWPRGMFQRKAEIIEYEKLGKPSLIRHETDVCCATLLEDGRFAFLIQKEDEDLRSFIDRKMMESGHAGGGPFSTVDAEVFMFRVALGVDRLHRSNIVHRDLKASNVLVCSRSLGNICCVVADYECSIGVVGTRFWRAPEILQACKEKNVKDRSELFSITVDIYSLGMTFYEILTGKHPFQDEDMTIDDVIEGRQPHVPEFVDEWARQLLHRCWQSDCNARPSVEGILGTIGANSSSEYVKRYVAFRRRVGFSDGS